MASVCEIKEKKSLWEFSTAVLCWGEGEQWQGLRGSQAGFLIDMHSYYKNQACAFHCFVLTLASLSQSRAFWVSHLPQAVSGCSEISGQSPWSQSIFNFNFPREIRHERCVRVRTHIHTHLYMNLESLLDDDWWVDCNRDGIASRSSENWVGRLWPSQTAAGEADPSHGWPGSDLALLFSSFEIGPCTLIFPSRFPTSNMGMAVVLPCRAAVEVWRWWRAEKALSMAVACDSWSGGGDRRVSGPARPECCWGQGLCALHLYGLHP